MPSLEEDWEGLGLGEVEYKNVLNETSDAVIDTTYKKQRVVQGKVYTVKVKLTTMYIVYSPDGYFKQALALLNSCTLAIVLEHVILFMINNCIWPSE